MHVRQVLSRWLEDRAVIGHAMRATALVRVVQALVFGGKAALTQLGRHRAGSAHVKHHVKAVDRLLGNRHLHRECVEVYRAIARTLFSGVRRPLLAVDWSDFECGGGRKWAMLQAAVPVGGRAVAVYTRVFPFKRYNSPGAHREFLRGLQLVLPEECRPILVTDAGFRGPWFRAVEALGWDWVGRVRNKIKYLNEASGRWCFTDSLYKVATPVMRYIGKVLLSPRNGYYFRLYLVRAYAPAGGGRRKANNRRPNAKMYRKLHRAPWLLATSLPHEPGSERRIKQALCDADADRGRATRHQVSPLGVRAALRPQRFDGSDPGASPDSRASRARALAGRLGRSRSESCPSSASQHHH